MTVDVVYFNYVQNLRALPINQAHHQVTQTEPSKKYIVQTLFNKFHLSILNGSNFFLLFYLVNITLSVRIEITQCLILHSSEASVFVRFWEERANRGFEFKLNLKNQREVDPIKHKVV